MIALLVLAPLLRDLVLDLELGAALLSPNASTSMVAAAGVGLMVVIRLLLYGVGPGWVTVWVLKQMLR